MNDAKDFVLIEGKDKALQVFNDPNGKFSRGELYIMAYDFNGTRLAHPYLPETIGQNELNDTDPNGVTGVKDRRDMAANYGSGFIYYLWPNPAYSNALELKRAYVAKINDDWFISSGSYASGS